MERTGVSRSNRLAGISNWREYVERRIIKLAFSHLLAVLSGFILGAHLGFPAKRERERERERGGD